MSIRVIAAYAAAVLMALLLWLLFLRQDVGRDRIDAATFVFEQYSEGSARRLYG